MLIRTFEGHIACGLPCAPGDVNASQHPITARVTLSSARMPSVAGAADNASEARCAGNNIGPAAKAAAEAGAVFPGFKATERPLLPFACSSCIPGRTAAVASRRVQRPCDCRRRAYAHNDFFLSEALAFTWTMAAGFSAVGVVLDIGRTGRPLLDRPSSRALGCTTRVGWSRTWHLNGAGKDS